MTTDDDDDGSIAIPPRTDGMDVEIIKEQSAVADARERERNTTLYMQVATTAIAQNLIVLALCMGETAEDINIVYDPEKAYNAEIADLLDELDKGKQ